jgi:hypothetical protein
MTMSLIQAIRDPNLFQPWFKDQKKDGADKIAPSYTNWLCFISALFAIPMSPEQLTSYRETYQAHEPSCRAL